MPTRIYLPSTSNAPSITPAVGTGWTATATTGFTRLIAADKQKTSTAFFNHASASPSAVSPSTAVMRQYILGPLVAQTVSGTLTGVIRGLESNANLNSTVAIAVRQVSSTGTHVADMLSATVVASDAATTPPEFTTTAATRRFQDAAEAVSLPLTSRTFTAGQYIVIEIGFRKAGTSTAFTTTLRFGDVAATDFAHADALTTDLNPWVEFSGVIGIYGDITGSAAGTATNTGSIGKFIPGATGYAAIIQATPGVIGYWRLGEPSGTTAVDLSGQGHDGTYVGGVTLGQPGAIAGDSNTAALFDGTTGHVVIPDSVDWNLGDFTLEAWIKTTNAGVGRRRIVCQQDDTDYWLMSLYENHFEFGSSIDGFLNFSPTGDPNTGTWKHLVVVRNRTAGFARCYVDGVYNGTEATVSPAAANFNVNEQVYIGAVIYQGSMTERFAGLIDEVAIYSVALTPAQILEHYEAATTAPPYQDLTGSSAGVSSTSGVVDKIAAPVYRDVVGSAPGTSTADGVIEAVTPTFNWVDISGSAAGISTADAEVLVLLRGNLRVSTIYPPIGCAMTVGLIESSSQLARSMLVRQVVNARANNTNFMSVPLDPVAPGAILFVTIHGGPIPGYPNVGTPSWNAPSFQLSGQAFATGTTRGSIGVGTGGTIRSFMMRPSGGRGGSNARMVISVGGATVGELSATILEIHGARTQGIEFFGTSAVHSAITAQPFAPNGAYTPTPDAGIFIAATSTISTEADSTFEQIGMPGETWLRVGEETDGRYRIPYAVDVLLSQPAIGNNSAISTRWNIPASVRWGVNIDTVRGITPGSKDIPFVTADGVAIAVGTVDKSEPVGNPVDLTGFAAGVTDASGTVSSLPPLNLLFQDFFTRANSDTLGGNWVEASGSLEILDNSLHAYSFGTDLAYNTSPLGTGDYQVLATIIAGTMWNTGGRGIGLVARYQDANNFYLAWVDSTPPVIKLYRVENGNYNPIGTYEGTAPTDPVTVSILCHGTSIKVLGEGNSERISVEDNVFSSGYFGVRAFNAGTFADHRFNDVRVYSLVVGGSISGSTAGISTTSAILSTKQALTGVSVGTSTEIGQPTRRRPVVAVAAGASTAVGVVEKATAFKNIIGSTAGSSTTIAVATRRRSVTAISIGVSTTIATATRRKPLVATSTGSSTAVAQTTRRRPIVAASQGTATVTNQVNVKRLLGVYASNGRATALGTITPPEGVEDILAAPAVGRATVAATIARRRPITAASSGIAAATALPSRKRVLTAASAGITTILGQTTRRRPLVAASTGSTFVYGSVDKAGSVFRLLFANGAGSSSVAAAISRRRALVAASAGVTTVSVSLGRKHAILGAASVGSTNVTAFIVRKRALIAAASGLTTGSATLRAKRRLTSSIVASANVSGIIGKVGIKYLVASASGVATVSAALVRRRAIIASSVGSSSTIASIGRIRTLTVSTSGKTTTSALLTTRRRIVALSAGKTTVNGIIDVIRVTYGDLIASVTGIATTSATINRIRALVVLSAGRAIASGTITKVRSTNVVSPGPDIISSQHIVPVIYKTEQLIPYVYSHPEPVPVIVNGAVLIPSLYAKGELVPIIVRSEEA